MSAGRNILGGAFFLASSVWAANSIAQAGGPSLSDVFNSMPFLQNTTAQTFAKIGGTLIGGGIGGTFGAVSGIILGPTLHRQKEFEVMGSIMSYGGAGVLIGMIFGYSMTTDCLPPIKPPDWKAAHVAYLDTKNPNYVHKLTI